MEKLPVIQSESTDDLLKDFLLLNSCSCGSVGFSHGKAGIVLVLFELARIQKNELLEERAFELLQQTLVYRGKNLSFANGLAGVGFVLLYLIRNKFVEADYPELFGIQHRYIMNGILTGQAGGQHMLEYAELLMYLYFSRFYISELDFKEAESTLFRKLEAGFVQVKYFSPADLGEFYHCSALLMNIYGCTNVGKRWGRLIVECFHELRAHGKICESMDAGYSLMKYGSKHREPELFVEGECLIKEALLNIVPQTMSLREKMNFLYYFMMDERIRNMSDLKMVEEEFVRKLIAADPEELEVNITASLWHKAFYCGLAEGVARLLLIRLLWSRFEAKEAIPRIRCFFY